MSSNPGRKGKPCLRKGCPEPRDGAGNYCVAHKGGRGRKNVWDRREREERIEPR